MANTPEEQQTWFNHIYCDESSTHSGGYLLIGGIWVPKWAEPELRRRLFIVRRKHRISAELKWTKVSLPRLDTYKDWVGVLFQLGMTSVEFKCIVVRHDVVDYRKYHESDKELGFYKFYYQLISRHLKPQHTYWLFTDDRHNHKPSRWTTLMGATNAHMDKTEGVKPVQTVEPRDSKEEDIIQLADVLLGAFGYAWNEYEGSEAKAAVVEHIRRELGWPSLRQDTFPDAKKVNVWEWIPKGALWKRKTRPSS